MQSSLRKYSKSQELIYVTAFLGEKNKNATDCNCALNCKRAKEND
ncbi:hypothetical protein XNC3_920045 [Xenorhabdus nematophila F1]|nr:hypothetical protein XNC3_920045 [Xenorhabdus nematophila F1]